MEWTYELHAKYGEVVRVHPDELSFVGESAWHDIFISRPQLSKPKIGAIKLANSVPNLAQTENLDDHARQRRIIGNAFSDRALREQECILNTYTNLLVEKLGAKITASKDQGYAMTNIHQWYAYTTFDTLGDLQFGESFHSLENDQEHPWISAIAHGLKFGVMLTAFHHFPPLKAEWLLPRIVHEKAHEHFHWASKQIEKRMARKTERPDFMKYILDNSEEKGMSREEIDSNGNLLILAGSDTSATTCGSTTWFLVKNPRTLKKLQDEVRSSFQSMEDITVAAASKLSYLRAVIREALRLHPVGPVSVPRVVDRPGVIISGHAVPPGVRRSHVLRILKRTKADSRQTRVGIPQKTASRLPSNFVEPLTFHPERWLKDADPKFNADIKGASEPFMVGPRNCLGKKYIWPP